MFSLYNTIKFWPFCTPPHKRTWWLRWELGIVTRSYSANVKILMTWPTRDSLWIEETCETFLFQSNIFVYGITKKWITSKVDVFRSGSPNTCSDRPQTGAKCLSDQLSPRSISRHSADWKGSSKHFRLLMISNTLSLTKRHQSNGWRYFVVLKKLHVYRLLWISHQLCHLNSRLDKWLLQF